MHYTQQNTVSFWEDTSQPAVSSMGSGIGISGRAQLEVQPRTCGEQGHGWHSWWLAGLLSPGCLKSSHVISPPGRVGVSSQHGRRSTRSGHPREQWGSHSVSRELALEVTECHFCHPLVARTVPPPPTRFKGQGGGPHL